MESRNQDGQHPSFGMVVLLLVGSLVGGCKDLADADLDRCIGFEAQEDWGNAASACQDAVWRSPTSDAGRLAAGKLAVLKDKLAAKSAWDKAQEAAQAKKQQEAARREEAQRIAAGGWKRLSRPTDAQSRIEYTAAVTVAHEGEPALVRSKALNLMDKIRRGLAKAADVPASQIKATVGTASGSLAVAKGVAATVGSSPADAESFSVCSEAFLGTALLGIDQADLTAAGLRGLICMSDTCAAAFDLRPNRPDGGGIYGGDACLSLADVLDMAARR